MSEEEIKDMLLKQCLELTTNNDLRPPISAYNGVDIDDVVRACKQLQDKKTYLDLVKENQELKKQNDSLKQKLNWIAFGDDSELALRYLRKIGYVDFDEERKVYINKHNNEPFLLEDEQEKGYYIKDDELNEYTEQLEYQIKELKKQLEEFRLDIINGEPYIKLKTVTNQQQKFIEYLENMIKIYNRELIVTSAHGNYDMHEEIRKEYKEILSKYKEIIGDDK